MTTDRSRPEPAWHSELARLIAKARRVPEPAPYAVRDFEDL